ncbi:predicted protein [Arabidopsis lyrata subsp. lyrata]|uniref:Predicted protein n=1 Tax=Arabidopsis lyrata subsp. lyrata TaxID=81972 RepID=D7LWL9_ARALL|nr:predicted protein [Arabidopsis lyrata subsp. lyrata]
MDELAIKGLKLLELNDNGADSQTPRSILSNSCWKNISLHAERSQIFMFPKTLKGKSSRGLLASSLPALMLNSANVAFMRIEGEDVEEKALQLSGTDVGGWTAIVKPKPKEETYLYVNGEICLGKALKLSGRYMGGMTLVVEPLVLRPEKVKNRRPRYCTTTGYMPQVHKFAKKKNKALSRAVPWVVWNRSGV